MLKNVLLSAVTLFSLLLAAEVLLRLSGAFPAAQLHSASQSTFERIPGLWEPNQQVHLLNKPKLPHRVRINALGLRGDETTLKPTLPRVLVIGDSFAFGDFVNDEETLPAQLELRLHGRAEVLNGGVGGTTIVDQAVFLEKMLVLEPRLVVLIFSENDLEDLLNDPPMHEQFARNRALKSGLGAPLYRFARDTSLFHLLLKTRAILRARRAQQAAETSASAQDEGPVDAELARRYAQEASRMGQLLKERGAAFFIAGFPSHYNVPDPPRQPTIPLVREAVVRSGVEFVDLTPGLRASGLAPSQLYLLPHDGIPPRRDTNSLLSTWPS